MAATKFDNGAFLRDVVSGRRAFLAAALLVVASAFTVVRFTSGAVELRDNGSEASGTVVETAEQAYAEPEPAVDGGAAGNGAGFLPAGPELFAFAPITDGVPRVDKPAVVRGIYLNAWAAGSPRKLARLIELADRTELNTFVIDVKEGGEISYRSQVPLARQIGADSDHIRDIRGVLRQLREHGIYPVARIVVFRDAVLARARPDWAVRHRDGGEWIDAYGHYWVDSYNRDVWDYNIAIAREALELGFSEVQWDYVRFPDVPQSLLRQAHWPARADRSMADGIREFLLYSRAQLAPYGVPITADVFGLTVSARTDMGIGQLWEKMVDAADVLLPMVYPSHFARGSYGIAQPNAAPFEIIRTSMEHAVRRTAGVANGAAIRPWLQDFTLGAPRYGPEHVRAQIDGVYAAGLSEWILWNPGSNYTEAALADRAGIAPDLRRPVGGSDAGGGGPARRAPLGTPVPRG